MNKNLQQPAIRPAHWLSGATCSRIACFVVHAAGTRLLNLVTPTRTRLGLGTSAIFECPQPHGRHTLARQHHLGSKTSPARYGFASGRDQRQCPISRLRPPHPHPGSQLADPRPALPTATPKTQPETSPKPGIVSIGLAHAFYTRHIHTRRVGANLDADGKRRGR